MERPKFGQRFLTQDKDVFQHNAWDSVEWDEEQRKEADAKIAANSVTSVDGHRVEELERDANRFWDKFYETHQRDFFKDRHWLLTEFNELLATGKTETFKIFEIGCGVGNTIFPILSMNLNSDFFVYGCDFSSVAINLLKSHKSYDETRVNAFVLDASNDSWNVPFPKQSIDVIVMIFTLSAIDPKHFSTIIQNVYDYLRPGGLLLFRDYGRYDMAQLRFKVGHCLGDNFYVRGDGTRAYFFDEAELHHLFTTSGLVKQEMFVDRRLQVNRGKQIKMYRVWIQAKYRKPSQDDV